MERFELVGNVDETVTPRDVVFESHFVSMTKN